MSKTATEKKTKFTKEQYLKWYESMLLMRRFEEKTGQVEAAPAAMPGDGEDAGVEQGVVGEE